VSLVVQEGPRSVRMALAGRPTAARTTLLLLAGIWIAFAVVWAALVLAFGGSILLALASPAVGSACRSMSWAGPRLPNGRVPADSRVPPSG
jgi:hypothetical protein